MPSYALKSSSDNSERQLPSMEAFSNIKKLLLNLGIKFESPMKLSQI